MENFQKTAIIESPPAMLADISDFCIGVYAYKILAALHHQKSHFKKGLFGPNTQQIEAYTNKIGQFFLEYARKTDNKTVSVNGDVVSYYAPLNFDGWNCPFGDAKQFENVLKTRGFDGINCRLNFTGANTQAGLWSSRARTLDVYIQLPQLETMEDFWKESSQITFREHYLHDTVEHELIHMTQLIGFYMRGTKDLIGLPSRKVRDNKQPFIVAPNIQRTEENLPHSLNDVEFYTNLKDSINSFSQKVVYLNPELKPKYVRVFLGTQEGNLRDFPKSLRPRIHINPFFRDLKNNNLAKWKLAVKRFLGYIQKHPSILK